MIQAPEETIAERKAKKNDALDRRCRAVEHVGLLADGPPGAAGLSFLKSSHDPLPES
jgi:hypothetical protein